MLCKAHLLRVFITNKSLCALDMTSSVHTVGKIEEGGISLSDDLIMVKAFFMNSSMDLQAPFMAYITTCFRKGIL